MAIPPPGDASGGSAVAGAGDNPINIRVPDSEEWTLYSIAARNQTNVVRVNISIGWGNERAVVCSDTQSSTSDYVVFNHSGLKLPKGQIITIDFIACTASDALEYSLFFDRRRITN